MTSSCDLLVRKIWLFLMIESLVFSTFSMGGWMGEWEHPGWQEGQYWVGGCLNYRGEHSKRNPETGEWSSSQVPDHQRKKHKRRIDFCPWGFQRQSLPRFLWRSTSPCFEDSVRWPKPCPPPLQLTGLGLTRSWRPALVVSWGVSVGAEMAANPCRTPPKHLRGTSSLLLHHAVPKTYLPHNCKFVTFDQNLPISPTPKPLVTTVLLSVSVSSAFLDTIRKWYQITFVFLWVTYFT